MPTTLIIYTYLHAYYSHNILHIFTQTKYNNIHTYINFNIHRPPCGGQIPCNHGNNFIVTPCGCDINCLEANKAIIEPSNVVHNQSNNIAIFVMDCIFDPCPLTGNRTCITFPARYTAPDFTKSGGCVFLYFEHDICYRNYKKVISYFCNVFYLLVLLLVIVTVNVPADNGYRHMFVNKYYTTTMPPIIRVFIIYLNSISISVHHSVILYRTDQYVPSRPSCFATWPGTVVTKSINSEKPTLKNIGVICAGYDKNNCDYGSVSSNMTCTISLIFLHILHILYYSSVEAIKYLMLYETHSDDNYTTSHCQCYLIDCICIMYSYIVMTPLSSDETYQTSCHFRSNVFRLIIFYYCIFIINTSYLYYFLIYCLFKTTHLYLLNLWIITSGDTLHVL